MQTRFLLPHQIGVKRFNHEHAIRPLRRKHELCITAQSTGKIISFNNFPQRYLPELPLLELNTNHQTPTWYICPSFVW